MAGAPSPSLGVATEALAFGLALAADVAAVLVGASPSVDAGAAAEGEGFAATDGA